MSAVIRTNNFTPDIIKKEKVEVRNNQEMDEVLQKNITLGKEESEERNKRKKRNALAVAIIVVIALIVIIFGFLT